MLPVDRVAAAEFIVRRLYQRLNFGTSTCMAAAETEHPFGGDRWFWTDDNAKVVEFLTRPEIASRYANEAAEIYSFLRKMCYGPFIFRRVGMPRLLHTAQTGSEASFYHSMMHLRCDLPRGVVIAGIRFHDDRTADNLLLSANCVEFTHRGQQFSLPAETGIDDAATELDGHRLRLRHAGDLFFRARRQEMRLGRVAYLYTIDARSMAFSVEVTLDVDPNAEVSDVVLTVGHDYLSHGTLGVSYNRVFARQPRQAAIEWQAEARCRQVLPAAGAEYYSIVQSEMAGFALAVHSAPREPDKLDGIQVLVRDPGRLHFVGARYRFPGACRGRTLVAAEDKMLTAGGFYDRVDDYSRLLREAVATRPVYEAAIDFSVSYDYGAEINAFAQYFAAGRNGDGGLPRAEAKVLFDAYLESYFQLFLAGHDQKQNTIFSRQLAFVIVALATMYRETGNADYRNRMAQLCDVLLQFEKTFADVAGETVSGFMAGLHSQRIVFVDCHSAALLALTEAANHIRDPRFAAAIERGLGCFGIETTMIVWLGIPTKIDVVAVYWTDDHGNRHTNAGFWNFHAGLMLRFFAALRKSADPAVQAVAARHQRRIELFEIVLRWQIKHSLDRRDGTVEIRSSTLSTETNSETQPWAAVGLLERGWA